MQTIAGVRVRWFTSDEFIRPAAAGEDPINWETCLDPRLVLLADVLRNLWGRPIKISDGNGTIGRWHGTGYHNPYNNSNGLVMALDTIPGIKTRQDARKFVELAEAIGLGGIGIYPHWNQGVGAHIDTGPFNRRWGYIGARQVTLNEAINAIPEHQP